MFAFSFACDLECLSLGVTDLTQNAELSSIYHTKSEPHRLKPVQMNADIKRSQ